MFSQTANAVTGRINKQYNKVDYYLHLKKTNDSLILANERLYNQLKKDYNLPDSFSRIKVDSLKVDSILTYKRVAYVSAKVVSNSVTSPANYLVLSGPNTGLFTEGMGVVDLSENVVGRVVVSGKFPVVMSLLHKDSKISGKLFKGGEVGTVVWEVKDPTELLLINIPKSAKVAVGDSVVTSGFTTTFPKGMLLGRVKEVEKETTNNNFRIKLHTAANFYNLEYAYGIQNTEAKEINEVLGKLNKQDQ